MPNLIYFGNFDDADSGVGTGVLENVTRSGASELQVVSATITDPEGDDIVHDNEFNNTSFDGNNSNPDLLTYTLEGGSEVTVETDATMRYSAEITLSDGSTITQNVIVLQMVNGDVFINDLLNGDQLDGLSIQSIRLVEFGAHFRGWRTSQSIDGAAIVCFSGDVMIETPQGERPARELKAGDLVATYDAGYQPLLWVYGRRFSAEDLKADSRRRPVRVRAGALGRNMPHTDLLVSRQHRLLLESDEAPALFGAPEVLVAAIKLRNYDGIAVDDEVRDISYVHLMLREHHVVYSNGLPSESMYNGEVAVASLTVWEKLELLAVRPDLFGDGIPPGKARPFVENRKQIRALFGNTPPRAPGHAADVPRPKRAGTLSG